MAQYEDLLWPYKKSIAFLAIPVIWLFFIFIFIAGQKLEAWQNIAGSIIIVIAIISFVPLLLMLLDFFSLKQAVLDIKGVKIDFSKVEPGISGGEQITFELPDNIGIPGAIVTDSSAMSIAETLNIGAGHEIVVVNIKSGDAWWVTRLLVLCAGAVRTGSPKVLVFLGKKENTQNYFLGLGYPTDLLKAILNDKPDYRIRYEKATQLARQFLFYKNMIGQNPTLLPPPDITRYVSDPLYMGLNEEITEQIILDQMGNVFFDINKQGSLENPPDRLTINRINQLFEHCLFKDMISLNDENEKQIKQLLNANSSYLALVKNDQYIRILKKNDGESLILKELVLQFEKENKKV